MMMMMMMDAKLLLVAVSPTLMKYSVSPPMRVLMRKDFRLPWGCCAGNRTCHVASSESYIDSDRTGWELRSRSVCHYPTGDSGRRCSRRRLDQPLKQTTGQ
jgi:hypothetical protein